jgi:hypothetical protein
VIAFAADIFEDRHGRYLLDCAGIIRSPPENRNERGRMYHEEKTFRLRVTLEASFPDDYDGEEDESNWIREWESRINPT